ncbi:MAG TPA: hypothetical protein VL332_00210 [Candidatus Saccharimonadaceae bacterium]|jgi:hypothetical protein|nr:hypothetical protein [Candidatus Saccharimonadaceae bacterium]
MKTLRVLAWTVVAVCVAGSALAAPIAGGARRAQPARSTLVDNSQRIDINNVSMVVTNTGSFAYDKLTGNAGLEFPKGTGKTAVFAAGLWIGAKVGGITRVAVAEYSDEYGPGAMVGNVADDPNKAEYKVYKLDRVYDDTATRDAVLADYNAGAVPHGAPVVTVQGDGSLDILGDQMTWAVYNDADPANHTNRAGDNGQSAANRVLGVEIQQTTFAFNRQGALGNTIFIKYRIINKGVNTLDSMFVSQWSDPDLGGAGDDLVGCDPSLGLGYVYNATNADQLYSGQPPAVGYDFFKGPTIPGPITLGMTSFNKYINGTDPNTAFKSYNYMKGLDADGNIVINPVTSSPTTFQVSGDPVTGSGWLDASPADRRLMLSSGPFTMATGDTQEVVAAIVVGQSKNRLASISLMKFFDTFAQTAFDANFDLPNPPQSPRVTPSTRDGSVFLSWDTRAENYNQAPYQFEGYVVYQGASVAGPFTRIATYDKVDGITTVVDDDFNEDQGLILPIGKAFGQDVGLKYGIELDQDAVRGGPLFVGQKYFFAVTAYAVDLSGFPKVLESAFQVIPVIPQTPAAGTDLASAQIGPIAQGQVVANPNGSTDIVTSTVIEPENVLNADYRVGFKPAGPTSTEITWYLVRTVGATVDTVINNWTDFAGDDANPIVDGIQVKIVSQPPGLLARVSYVDTTGGNPAAIQGVDEGLPFFGGGAGYAADLFGSSIASGSTGPNVTVRFTGGPAGQKAYRYERCNCSPRTYLIQNFVDVPFKVYDTDSNTQLNVAFLENAPGTIDDGIWDPDDSPDGQRELLWVMSSTYTGTIDSTYFKDPTLTDVLNGNIDFWYAVWPNRTSAGAVIDAGDKLLFTTSIPSSANDYFTFSTTAANRSDAALAKSEMARIRAVPNPYFSHSTYETNQFSRVLKFTHLPARCTVRIFNLAGDKVRTLDKNDDTSQLTWDLETDHGLPVGSGIYIFHVDAPGFGTHVGKVAVFMEKERLNNF